MTKYQLGKLIDSAGTLQTRKRIQKVVHLLQSAGMPFNADYRLHHYGPYSAEVATLLAELVNTKLLVETPRPNGAGREFHYHLAPDAAASLRQYEVTSEGKVASAEFEQNRGHLDRLLGADLRSLELASTIAFFREKGNPWEDALAQACEFKKVGADTPIARGALELAEAVVG